MATPDAVGHAADAHHEHPHGHEHHDHAQSHPHDRDDDAHAQPHAHGHETDHVHPAPGGAPAQDSAHHPDGQGQAHDHGHPHDHGRLGWPREVIPFLHSHRHSEVPLDAALEGSARGLWALKVSLVGLGVTALFQLAVVLVSGSVGLLADTIHNFGDALTALPLGLAFVLGRRAATRRYTYGYGRAEDLAGVAIVLLILASAVVAAYESVEKLVHPQPLDHLGWVMAAAVVGFLGNEAVAKFRMNVGREIGSAALVADGQHARVDGFTSLAVLVGALGVLIGFPLADPIVGLLITVAILVIVKDTALVMWRRLMDAVDPALVDRLARAAAGAPGVERVEAVRARWLGHRLEAEVRLVVNEDLPTRESHDIAEVVRHALFHEQPRLAAVTVHVDPCGHGGADPHGLTAHHAVAGR